MSSPTRLAGIACRRLRSPELILDNVYVEFDGPRIGVIGDFSSSWLPPGGFNARGEGLTVVPGFIDVHLHGCAGADYLDRNFQAMQTISRQAAKGGATSIIATTTIPADDRSLTKFSRFVEMLRAVHRAQEFQLPTPAFKTHAVGAGAGSGSGSGPGTAVAENGGASEEEHSRPAAEGIGDVPGARIVGIHMEGPWISPEKPGSFGSRYLFPIDLQLVDRMLDIAGDLILKVTLAPELENGEELLEMLTNDPRSRAEVSFAHTMMTYEDAKHYFETNPRARHVTHAFNAMEPLRHREPGLICAGLLDDRVSMEIIADGFHVAPPVMMLLHRMKGAKRLMAVTDGTGATGTTPGTIVESIAGATAVVDGVVRRVSDGTISGADISMADGFNRLQHLAGIPFEEALEMCTLTPATSLHCESELGSIDPGKRADFAVLRPDGSVYATIRDGLLVYAA